MRRVLFLRYGLVMVCFSWLITGLGEGASEIKRESPRGLSGIVVASNEKKDQPCATSPEMLRWIDTWERDNKKLFHVPVDGGPLDGQSITPEELAEFLIADCSQDIAKIAGMAAAVEHAPPFLIFWKENLEFMKWWLKNRHQKLGHPPHE